MGKDILNDHPITMPPGGRFRRRLPEETIGYDDTLTITFNDAGWFGSTPLGVFEPEVPMALFLKGSVIRFKPREKKDKDVYLVFLDMDKVKTHLFHVKIRP